jgi:hypothetical protein
MIYLIIGPTPAVLQAAHPSPAPDSTQVKTRVTMGPVPQWSSIKRYSAFSKETKKLTSTNIILNIRVVDPELFLVLRKRPSSISVADPNPDPPDPHVFGPPGSGSTGQRYGSGSCSGSGSGSFYHHAKIVRKTLILTIL